MELTRLSLDAKRAPSTILPSYGVFSHDGGGTTLDEWVKRCGDLAAVHAEEVDTKKMFVDEHGTLRYAENWQSVESSLKSAIKEDLSNSGCMNIPVGITTSTVLTGTKTNENTSTNVYNVRFMMDFRVLWNHFEVDGYDEVAEYSPMFRIYVETFFHRRTIQLMIFLTLYINLVMVVVNQIYNVYGAFEQFQYYFYVAIQGIVYLALVRLFKGSLFGADPRTATTDGDCKDASNWSTKHIKRGIKLNQPSSWKFFAREAMETTSIELQRFLSSGTEPAKAASFSNREKATPFYAVLGIALKFLTKHSKEGGAPVRLNRRVHNAKLLFIFIIVPIYSIIQTCAAPIGTLQVFIASCKMYGDQSGYCQNGYWICILTFGYIVVVVQKVIFMSAVLLSLVGLSFGAEVGRGLVDSWIHRFGMLRRLSADIGNKSPQPAAAERKDDTVINALHAAVSLDATPHSRSAPPALSIPVADIQPYLQRDAFEHYLFIKEYMSISSAAWSPTIVALTFLDAFFVLLFVYGAFSVGTQLSTAVWIFCGFWIGIRVCVLTIYPIMALAHANAYVHALQEQFLVAAPEDFAVIGGRDSWLEYLDKVPAMWTIYGVWVTWDRLTGLLWTGVAGVGAIVITFVSSSAAP